MLSRTPFIISLFFIAITTASVPTYAQQTKFNKANRGLNTEFTYTWKHQDAEYTLSFAIETTTLYAMPPSPPAYSPKIFQDNVYMKVMETAKNIDPKTAKIKVSKNHSGLSFNVSSREPEQAQKVLDKLKLSHDKAQDDYWADNYFVKYNSATGTSGIRHDHAKYTTNSSSSLISVVEAIKELQTNPLNSREFITIALGWIQSIPYNRLEDRLSSNGAGFVSPRDLLLQNQGDCDSKSTLMAALLKAYNARLDVQMVYLPEHALLAIDMRSNNDEMTLRHQGKDFVLLEPTGPAQLSLGKVAESTIFSLQNRRFDLASMSR
ncbi:MAG: hypothetical protein ACJAVV_002423 [Alphaproteobacteria bacterium]|jgi:hypothetical protein